MSWVLKILLKNSHLFAHILELTYSFHYSSGLLLLRGPVLVFGGRQKSPSRIEHTPPCTHTQWALSPFPPVMSLSVEGDIILKQCHSSQ